MQIKRRSFLKSGMFIGAASMGLFPKQKVFASEFLPNQLYSNGPIQSLDQFAGSQIFTGDDENEGHNIFWDKAGFLKKYGPIPVPSETYDLVIVGGGMAGLVSAYFHKHKKTLLIDGHPQMGGNSKGEQYQNLGMSIGAAYINVPEEGDAIHNFFKELGIAHKFRTEQAHEATTWVGDKLLGDFWQGSSDPARADEFQRVLAKFSEIYEEHYPELPDYSADHDREYLNQLDRLSLGQWVKQELGQVHPHIHEFFHQYCWTSFGGEPEEISAAQAIGFISSDLAGVQTLPAGNAGIAQAIYNKLKHSQVRMQNHSFAVHVVNSDSGVEVVTFENGKLKTVKAKKVIMSCPKLVAKYLIADLPDDQYQAMKSMRYRAYLLVNVLLAKKVPSLGYDIFAQRGEAPRLHVRKEMEERGFCDLAFADWANFDQAGQSALTLYIPMPFEGANQFLFSPFTYEKHRTRILKNLVPWLKQMGLSEKDVLGMRMSRYGHALPLARTGLIANGQLELAHRTIDDRIYFAHSDNWANPCFETAFFSSYAIRNI